MTKSTPIDGFIQHGLAPEPSSGGQSVADCPFCGREGKFYINDETAAWKCWKCGKAGGLKKFLALKTVTNNEEFQGSAALRLSRNRGISTKTMREFRIGWDGLQYTIPVDACSDVGSVYDLLRYLIGKKAFNTSGGNVSVGGISTRSERVWLTEGVWDAMALWECLQENQQHDSVFFITGNALPAHALPLFQGKHVILAFDNDDGGRQGAQRANNMLKGCAKTLEFVHWPERFPEKYDVRDLYLKRKEKMVAVLLQMLRPEVPGIVEDAPIILDGDGLSVIDTTMGYRKWLFLPDAEVISVMYGVLFANRFDGDPIWLFIVAPPGGTKSELLMSLTDAPLTHSTDGLTRAGLISGIPSVGGVDPSLIPQIDGKVLVIKDVTTILKLREAQRDEIFGILRAAYDGKAEWIFGNGMHRVYYSKFGILGGVTPLIEKFGAEGSVLGERFLKYRLHQTGRIKTGDNIIKAALDNIGRKTKMRNELKEISTNVLNVEIDAHDPPKLPRSIRNRLIRLAQWVASLRGVVSRERYSNKMEFKATQEVGTRIAIQLAKLAMGIAVFHKKSEVSEEEYQMIVSVGRSTIPDKVEELIKQLFLKSRTEFVSVKELAAWSNLEQTAVESLLNDLYLLRVVQREEGSFGRGDWRLSRTVLRMMRPLKLYKKEENWAKAKESVKKKR